jgi:hypothetical protein
MPAHPRPKVRKIMSANIKKNALVKLLSLAVLIALVAGIFFIPVGAAANKELRRLESDRLLNDQFTVYLMTSLLST